MTKGLEALKELHRLAYGDEWDIQEIRSSSIIEKELKALNSIKDVLLVEIDNGHYWLRTRFAFNYIKVLTKEEYELWKEVLENE